MPRASLGDLLSLRSTWDTARLRAMNVQTSLNPAGSSPKQPMPSPRTVPSYLLATGPNDKRADLTGQISSSGVWWVVLAVEVLGGAPPCFPPPPPPPPPPEILGFCQNVYFSFLTEAQRHAQYRGRYALVRQVECAH